MRQPTPRPHIYDLYWYFAAERMQMFERRVAGQPAPWTADPILAEYKFCNVFRASDRVSQYLIGEVIYADSDAEPADMLFRIVAFRIFSKIETWETIRSHLGRQPRIDDLENGSLQRAIEAAKAQGPIYTNAFILCATDAYGYRQKYLNHLELWRHMFVRGGLAEKLIAARTLEEVYELLHEYPLMGDFMSYQIAVDLNYSPLLGFSENDFTKAGPGARRGIKKVFEDTDGLSDEEIIHWMVARQDDEFARLGLAFNGLRGRKLHAIDAQGLFCEVDKYCREAAPDLASARVRIKAKYQSKRQPISYFYPPKWNLESATDRAPQG